MRAVPARQEPSRIGLRKMDCQRSFRAAAVREVRQAPDHSEANQRPVAPRCRAGGELVQLLAPSLQRRGSSQVFALAGATDLPRYSDKPPPTEDAAHLDV